MFLIVKSLLSSDSVNKIDPDEVWKTAETLVPLAALSRVIDILLEF